MIGHVDHLLWAAQRLARSSERNKSILAGYLAGETQTALAERHRVTRARISQIVWPFRSIGFRFRRVA